LFSTFSARPATSPTSPPVLLASRSVTPLSASTHVCAKTRVTDPRCACASWPSWPTPHSASCSRPS
ncbi:hypothetical protein BG000_001039, partial [Podila horticola]